MNTNTASVEFNAAPLSGLPDLAAGSESPAGISDMALVGNFLQGDETAFVEIMRRYQAKIFTVANSLLQNHADAEEITQDTFVRAHRSLPRFRGDSSLATWLHRIALNLARSQVRQNCGDLLEFVEDTVLNQCMDETADPAKKEELRQTVVNIDNFLATLSPDIRATFEAVIDGDVTYEEVSAELNIPIGTVRSRVSRVRSAVRAAVN